MKIRYESEDGVVSGYGDDGKAAVETYEADPLAKFKLPWTYDEMHGWRGSNETYMTSREWNAAAGFFSAAAPLIQEVPDDSLPANSKLRRLKAILKEAING